MGSTKDYLFELDQDRCNAWIQERLGDRELDEESEIYIELALEYANMNAAYDEEAEYRWLQKQSLHAQYIGFDTDLKKAAALLRDSERGPHSLMVCKLVYAHAVTLLETMISTSVQALVVRDKKYLLNIANQFDGIYKGKKHSISDIAKHPKGVEGIILKSLSELTFHNPTTIKTVLHALIGARMADLDVGSITTICRKRHDIVHRNGKTLDDVEITLDPVEVYQAIHTINELASEISRRIHEDLAEPD